VAFAAGGRGQGATEVALSSRRFLVAAFGDAGHAFPAIALARALRARGHEVLVETWERWREAVEAEGLGFTAAEEYKTFPPPAPGSAEGASAADAAVALLPLMEEFGPHVVVSDILTAAPALAAEKARRRRATLIPHVYPVHQPGMPFFSFGAQPPRTPLGKAMWRAWLPVLTSGLRRGRREMNETRAAVGLAPVDRLQGGISTELALVATFPQLEYPRRWPAHVEVTGPMKFELPYPEIELPEGDEPLVLVAPSTAQDPGLRLVRAALEGLAEEPVRVVATTNRREGGALPGAPGNATLVDWLSYSQLMPEASLVVCHGGHGTVARALGAGAPLLCCPAVGDMAENSARVAWAGAGLMLPWRLTGPASVRWSVRRILGDREFSERATKFAAWARRNDGGERGAELVELLGD
jgi:UDP:flavonoid glycosyltransferase YjiC (YdhE family)